MSVGTGVDVVIGEHVEAILGDWETERTNLFGDPRAAGSTSFSSFVTQRTNLAENPRQVSGGSFRESGARFNTIASRLSGLTDLPYGITTALRYTTQATSSGRGVDFGGNADIAISSLAYPVSAGQQLEVSVLARSSWSGDARLGVRFRNDTTWITSFTSVIAGPTNASTFSEVSYTVTVPVGATAVSARLFWNTDSTPVVAGQTFDHTGIYIGVPGGYFDGASAAPSVLEQHAWSGAANASTSVYQTRSALASGNWWNPSSATMTQVDGSAFGTEFATRFAALNTGATRGGMRLVGAVSDTQYTVRFKVRSSVDWPNFAFYYRPSIGSATDQAVIQTGVTLTPGVQEFEYVFTTPPVSSWGEPGVYLVTAAGATGRWFEVTDVAIEEGDTRGLWPKVFDGNNAGNDQVRYIWEGAENGSPSFMQLREVLVPGKDAAWWSTGEYSVVEDGTPIDPSDMTGGFGQISVSLPDRMDVRRTMGQRLSLTDGSMGETVGTVRSMRGNLTSGEVTADSRLGQLAVERTIQPYSGTLGNGLRYYLSLCGVTTGIVIDSAVGSRIVKLPGGRSVVYDQIKKMGAAYDFESTLVSNNIVFRPVRERTGAAYRDATTTWALDQEQLAQSVQGWAYNSRAGEDLAYPIQGDVNEAQVYQIEASEVQVFEIPLEASLSSVQQPICVDTVAFDYTASSVYSVLDSDDNVVNPLQWTRGGGSVVASLDEDTRTLLLTITGANLPALSPFRLAVSTGSNERYSSIRIRGEGIFWNKKLYTIWTSDNADLAPDEVGVIVDSEFMEDWDQLYHRLLRTAERYGTDRQTIDVESAGINRLGDTGSARYPTLADVDIMFPGATIGSIALELGPTIDDWNRELFDTVRDDFDNQAFGNVAGARILDEECYYRIRTATLTPSGVRYTAERDNTIGDVYHVGETIGDWNDRWLGLTVRDVNISPLLNLNVQAPEFLYPGAQYPGNDQFPAGP